MSRIPKWKIDKIKVKVVFRLQFHATHIPQPGWDKLFVSFIPADTVKMTAKTSKACVRNGSCKWSDPIYETTRLLQDLKTKVYDEKLYKLVVAMGSSKSGLLGEVSINLADFVDALKPTTVALPLSGCEFGTTLHVTVQLLTSKTGFREFEQQRELGVMEFQTAGKRNQDFADKIPSTSGPTFEHLENVNLRSISKGESIVLPSLEEVGVDQFCEDSPASVDILSHSSDSLCAEKLDVSSIPENDCSKSTFSGEVIGYTPGHIYSIEKGDLNSKQLLTQQHRNDRSQGWSTDCSNDNDMSFTCEENDKLNTRLELAESAFLQLKSEAMLLQSFSDELSAETKLLGQHLSIEIASGDKLAKEVNIVKSEILKFKNDLEELKIATNALHNSRMKTSFVQMKCCSPFDSLHNKFVSSTPAAENSQLPYVCQSNLLQGILLIESKARDIQKKACFAYGERELDFLYSEFGSLGCLIENLKQSITQESSSGLLGGVYPTKLNTWNVQSEKHAQGKHEGRCFNDVSSEGITDEKMCELLEQLEASKVQNESLTKRISEMECYYESLIHELEGGQKQTAHQLENLRAEHTSCLCMISALQNENDKLQHDMNAQLMRFSEEQQALKSYVKELEKRAISSETMLKRVRWNYSTAVDRMQKDLQLLSFQVLSMFEANETLAKEALSGASSEHLDELFEHMPHWYRAEWLAPLSQQQRPALSEVQREIAVTCSDQELSPMLNDTSDNVNDQMLNKFASIDEIKEASKTGSPMVSKFNLEIGNAPKDALKLLDTSMVYEIDVMQEKKDPLFSTHFPTEKERYNSLPSIPFAKDQKELKRVCLKSCKIQNMNDFCCCSELLSDNGDTMVETEIFFNKLKQLHASKETEILEAHMVSNHLEVYTRILHETLRDVFYGIGHMNSMITELQQQLDHCTIDKEMLTLKLHDLRDVADTLRKTEARYIKKYDNLESKNHIMEVKLHAALDEKSFLAQNVAECQWLVGEYGAYESMYKASVAEKLELETMLKEEILQRTYIQCKINSMVEDLKSLKESYDIQCSLNSNLQKCTTYLQCRLRDLCNGMISCVQEVSCTRFGHISAPEELNNENCDAIISFLEQLQQETRHLLIKLHQEKKLAEKQRDLFQGILFVKDSDISSLELQSKSHLEELITSLVLSNLNVENLQLELHNVTEQLRHSTEMEEKQRSNNKQLLSKMTNFLNGMIFCNQQVSCSLFDDISVPEKLDYENCDAIIFLLEHFGQHACHKLIKLHQEKKLAEEQREVAQCALDKKESHIFDMKQHFESELEEIRRKLELSNMKVEELQVELQDTVDKLTLTTTTAESHKLTSKGFLSKIANLCDHIVSFYQQVGSSLFDDIFVPQELNGENYDALISCLEQFQQVTCHKLVKLHEEQMLINEQREIAERTLNAKELHMSGMKQQFESELAEIRIKLELSNAKVENLEFKLQDTVDKLKLSIETVEKYKSKNRELSSKMAILEIELQQTADECRDFYQKLLVADSVNEELARTKSSLTESLQENKNLLSSIQLGNETSVKMKIELSSLRENLHFLREQLHSERKVRGKLDIVVADLTSKLEATNKQISYLDEQNAELCHLRTRVLDLEREMQHYLVYYEETCEKTNAETSSLHLQVADLDNHLASAIMHFIFSDVEVTYMRNQLYFMEEGILEHQKKSEDTLEELYLMHLDDVTSTKNFIANKAAFVAEIGRFSTDLQSTRSRLELIIGEKQSLVHHINDSLMELANFEDLNAKEASFEADCFEPPNYQYEVESCILRNMLLSFVAELDELWLSKVELDIVVVFLRSKVDACECELRKLRSQHNELNQKLLEQTLKTEQFKNLSIHLRELKDKADAEYHQTIERRESESSSIVGQESLRIAFIKEQYESKLQELRNQCSVSQKYAEEMLMKLQNALDEIEYRKKNEASLAKRNEDMAIELSDLDIELQTTTTDRKVLIKSYESMKADLECTVLCLKCCEEEKLKLENSLKDSSVEREKIRIELDLVKRLLENMATSTGPGIRHHVADRKATLIGELLGNGCSGTSVVFQETPITGRGSCIVDDQVTKCGADHVNGTGELYSCRELEDVDPTSVTGGSCLSVQLEQAKNIVEDIAPDRVMFLENNAKQLADMKEHFMEQQRLMASMELFHNQLERFKNDNLPSDFQLDERYLTADLQDLKTELQQLDMVNEQLESIFPTYKRLPAFGNSLERVLALELELAESLQVRKKLEGHLQSSFLKQHSDEESVFQSFRDINELIKDLLELKRRNAAVENELHEAHGRYSQLSLQFAELEGERQKLVKSLKNRTKESVHPFGANVTP